MPEEWMTYREIGARLGLNVEAVRTRVRRAGWRTVPGNDGKTRVLVPVEAVVEPVSEHGEGVNEEVNRSGGLTGLVALLAASEARISRLEGQLEAERDRVNEARSEADWLRTQIADLTARTDQAEQASTEAEQATTAAEARAGAAEARADTAEARADAAEAGRLAAELAAEELRQAEIARKGRGRWARLRAAWRGE